LSTVAHLMRAGLLLALAWLLATAPAAAQSADASARSRKHFEAGRALYDLGNYEDALREFNAGYALLPRPLFLLNIGQCHRKLHDYAKAKQSFHEFLARAMKDEPARPRALTLLQEVEREEAEAAKEAARHPPAPSSAPPPASPPEGATNEAAKVTAPAAVPTAPAVAAPSPSPLVAPPPPATPTHVDARRRKRFILGFSLGGAAALIAAGGAVALVLLLRPDQYPRSDLGNVGFGH
jgi:hypothetical protein